MGRREYRSMFTCAEPGCREVQLYAHDLRRDQADAYRRQHEKPFKCTRHAHPDQNLRPGNEQTTRVLIATRLKSRLPDIPIYNTDPDWPYLKGLFWVPEGGTTGSGFKFGPGFTAHASDFPEGTRLVVTAEIQPADAPSRWWA